ncbi:ribokinase [Paenibacillus eucommiae]|uniref:Ribokinase n=1 Tax=Paenibacillus eucommiae TaxID=1355755 RepID=A0ABS4IX32_9BACL|nr:ribokinase [Paenibacillus eucommiae]MBP1992134.1 ribokinase [Paenibacillus eucommiae]
MVTTPKAKIAVMGSYNVGLVVNARRMPEWGETILAEGFSECPGGKGSNQAVSVARLGGEVRFIGCVGRDHYGDDAIRLLTGEQVDIAHLKQVEGATTGVGFVFLNEHGDNCIIVDPGANLHVYAADIDRAISAIDESDTLLVQLESNMETTAYAMKLAKDRGKTVILNPAPAQANVDFLLEHATIVTPNESELKILSGWEPSRPLEEQDCIMLARRLLAKGPKAVVVTWGELGALIVLADEVIHVPTLQVTAKDTTGAGDAFNGALALALAEGQTIREAVQFACTVGAYTVTGQEVIPSLPTRVQLEAFCRQHEGVGEGI